MPSFTRHPRFPPQERLRNRESLWGRKKVPIKRHAVRVIFIVACGMSLPEKKNEGKLPLHRDNSSWFTCCLVRLSTAKAPNRVTALHGLGLCRMLPIFICQAPNSALNKKFYGFLTGILRFFDYSSADRLYILTKDWPRTGGGMSENEAI